MPRCKGKLHDDKPCPKIVKQGEKYCLWHDLNGIRFRRIYNWLRKAESEKKADLILKLIEDHPEHRLFLPAWDIYWADLPDVDLSFETLEKRINKSATEKPPWWEVEMGGADLRYASLQGANLWGANLKGACLMSANLQDADLSVANLQDALLAYADLQNATLASAHLKGVDLSSTKLKGADFRSADMQGTNLSHQDLQGAGFGQANLQGADFELANCQGVNFSNAHLQGAKFARANLQGTNFEQAHLESANLMDTNLQDSNLEWADLPRVNFRRANLQGVNFLNANLEGSDMREARLEGVDLSVARDMSGIYVSGAWLDRTRMRRKQLGDAIGEELIHDYTAAKSGYLALKKNFEDLGDYDAASWAYLKERRMEKLEARLDGNYSKFLSDTFVEWLCDYGESVWRVFGWMAALLFIVGPLLFSGFGGVFWNEDLTHKYHTLSTGHKIWFLYYHYLLYTLDVFTTASFSGLDPINDAVKLASGLFAIAGIVLAGLLGFVAGNRIRRS